MGTDSLFLALLEENIEDIILPEKKKTNRKQYFREIVQIVSLRMQQATYSREHIVLLTTSMIREPGLFNEDFRCFEKVCSCRKTCCWYDRKSNKFKFSGKGLNKTTLEDCGDGPIKQSVRRNNQRYVNQQRISNNET